jgi:hypothetical protein
LVIWRKLGTVAFCVLQEMESTTTDTKGKGVAEEVQEEKTETKGTSGEVVKAETTDPFGEYVPMPRGPELQKKIFATNKRYNGGGLWWYQEEELKKQRGFVFTLVFKILKISIGIFLVTHQNLKVSRWIWSNRLA